MEKETKPTSIGSAIKKFRCERNLTQPEFAAMAGINIGMVVRLERGEYGHKPVPSTIRKLAKAMKCSEKRLAAMANENY